MVETLKANSVSVTIGSYALRVAEEGEQEAWVCGRKKPSE